jgi:hypothetical protein
LLPQFVTVTAGVSVTGPQAFDRAAMLTLGGALITTVLLAIRLPQPVIVDNLMVYVPGLVKVKTGLTEEAVVLLAKLHPPVVPQLLAA